MRIKYKKGKMMKKIILMLLVFPVFSAFSADVDLDKVAKERAEWTKRHFAAQGSPTPDGGVVVMPEKQMSQYNRFKAQRIKEKADIKKYGYIKETLPQAQSLINFKKVAKHQLAVGKNEEEGLKHSINEIQMAYDFRGVPTSAVSTMLGVAPSVTYIKGQGWAGAMQYFSKDGLGTCSYRENNLKFSHGAAVIPEEEATKDVNGKVTVAIITGQKGSGFIYSVDWYDDSYFRELKCANEKYEPSIMHSALELARVIDNNS